MAVPAIDVFEGPETPMGGPEIRLNEDLHTFAVNALHSFGTDDQSTISRFGSLMEQLGYSADKTTWVDYLGMRSYTPTNQALTQERRLQSLAAIVAESRVPLTEKVQLMTTLVTAASQPVFDADDYVSITPRYKAPFSEHKAQKIIMRDLKARKTAYEWRLSTNSGARKTMGDVVVQLDAAWDYTRRGVLRGVAVATVAVGAGLAAYAAKKR